MLPFDYYSDMLGIKTDQMIFNNLLTKIYPKLVDHMQSVGYQIDLIAFQWLVTLFFNSLSHEAEIFVFTAFLLKGQKIIIKLALLIVDYFRPRLMKSDSFEQLYMIIANEPFTKITSKVICDQLKRKKYLKLTNSML